MPTTVHLGDCATRCNRCAERCSRNNHADCDGTVKEQAIGDWLVFLNTKKGN